MTITDDRVPPHHTDRPPRRLAGAAVLAGVLLVIVLVAAVRGHTVAGQPDAPPIQPAPQVGDCVLQNPHDLGAGLYDLPALRTGPCAGPRFAEVVYVVPAFTGSPPGTPLPDRTPAANPSINTWGRLRLHPPTARS